jgi:hypothetical protein
MNMQHERHKILVMIASTLAAVLSTTTPLRGQVDSAAAVRSRDSLRLDLLTREVGSEVRVSIPPTGRIEGRLVEVMPETIRIEQRIVPFFLRDTLWVKEPLGWTGAKYGAAAGLAGAGAILLFFHSMCGPGGDDPCTGFGRATLILGTGGAVFGAGAGLMAGQFIKHWVRKNPR